MHASRTEVSRKVPKLVMVTVMDISAILNTTQKRSVIILHNVIMKAGILVLPSISAGRHVH